MVRPGTADVDITEDNGNFLVHFSILSLPMNKHRILGSMSSLDQLAGSSGSKFAKTSNENRHSPVRHLEVGCNAK